MTSVQIARGWFDGNSRGASRTLTALERGGFVWSVGMSLFADPDVTEPLFRWSARECPEPEFNGLAYQLSVRQPAMKRGRIWTATRKAFAEFGGQTRSVRRTDWEHDIAVSGIWMALRERLEASGDSWILEDDLHQTEDFPDVAKPDAMIRQNDGRIILIERGGRYSAETLRRKHESWSALTYWLY